MKIQIRAFQKIFRLIVIVSHFDLVQNLQRNISICISEILVNAFWLNFQLSSINGFGLSKPINHYMTKKVPIIKPAVLESNFYPID